MNDLANLLDSVEAHLNEKVSERDKEMFTIFIIKHLPVALENLPVLYDFINHSNPKSDIHKQQKELALGYIYSANDAINQWHTKEEDKL